MGRVIRADELWSVPLRLADRQRQQVRRLLAAAEDDRSLLEGSRERIVRLALGMAERIVGCAVELEPAVLDEIYRESLERLGTMPPASIQVHPEDRERAQAERLARELGCPMETDPTVGIGGCRVVGDGATVDASIQTLLGALREALEGRRGD